MTFSQEIKEELSKISNLANKEELKYEFLGYIASYNIDIEEKYIKYSTENDYNIDRFGKVLRNIGFEEFEIGVNGKIFSIEIRKNIEEILKKIGLANWRINNLIDDKRVYIQAFIRGLFMGAGSINNPEKKYHLECKIRKKDEAQSIIDVMKINDINLKQRDNIIYIKDGEEISKFLAFIGAAKSVMKFEEIRVERHMNNKVNRLVNCETANLNKVLNASIEQINAIKKLKQNGDFEKLDDGLKEIANLRVKYPDISLVELGQKMSKPIGKSGVNYRLKKIVELSKE